MNKNSGKETAPLDGIRKRTKNGTNEKEKKKTKQQRQQNHNNNITDVDTHNILN